MVAGPVVDGTVQVGETALVLAGKGCRPFLIETNTEGPLRKKHQRNLDDVKKLVTKCD